MRPRSDLYDDIQRLRSRRLAADPAGVSILVAVSAADILKASPPPTRMGQVEKWLLANPQQAKTWWEVVRLAEDEGRPLQPVLKKAQEMLGGPPGSHVTLARAVRELRPKA